jgi:hypothetical protein
MGIIAVIGITLIILRFFVRKILQGASSTSRHFSISQMKKDPQKAIAYAAALDMPFTKKKDIGDAGFQLICARLQSLPALGNYKILHTQQIDASQLLVMTELAYKDFVTDLKGNTYDTSKKALHDFVFRLDGASGDMDLYSDLITDATTKFQKQEFVMALFESNVPTTA